MFTHTSASCAPYAAPHTQLNQAHQGISPANVLISATDVLAASPVAQVAHLRYHVGKIVMLEEQFKEAVQHFQEALRLCPPSCHRNRKLILRDLIPAQLLLGRLPAPQLLTEEHGVPQYANIVRAMERGDVNLWRRTLAEHADTFIAWGVYLALARGELQVYRRLFRRATRVVPPGQIPLQVFQSACEVIGVESSTLEVECVLSTLIANGWMKAFILPPRVIASKTDPWPKMKL